MTTLQAPKTIYSFVEIDVLLMQDHSRT